MSEAHEAAQIISDAIPGIERARHRKTTRFQLSLISISRITGRDVMDSYFMNQLTSELSVLGWCMFQVENTRYAFVQRASVQGWVKLSSKRFLNEDESQPE